MPKILAFLLVFCLILSVNLTGFDVNNSSQNATTSINKINNSVQSANTQLDSEIDDEQSAISSSSNGREYMYKTIIRLYRPDNVELIDLHQIGNEAKPDRVLFDSSEELKKNNLYLQYEDTDEDAILITGYSKLLSLELNLSTNGEEFLGAVFENFIQNANTDKSLQLFNSLANKRYDSEQNFARLTNSTLYKRMDSSKFLDIETSFDRMYIKTPEFILLVLIDDCYFSQKSGGWWIFRRTSDFVSFKVRYKIYSLKAKKVLKSRKYTFSFAVDETQNDKYNFIAKSAGDKLKSHLAEVMRDLKKG